MNVKSFALVLIGCLKQYSSKTLLCTAYVASSLKLLALGFNIYKESLLKIFLLPLWRVGECAKELWGKVVN